MSIIYLAKGTATMGMTKRDADGNIVESKPAQFTFDGTGPCVAIGELDPETFQPKEPIKSLFGDYDAAGYLAQALELLQPSRAVNIPDFKAIIQAAVKENARERDYFCDYCQNWKCSDCIVNEWMDEVL